MVPSFITASVLLVLCACAGILSVLSEEMSVTAHVGENIDLHCKVSREDAVITMIQWSRADLKTNGYVYLFHNNRSHRLYHLPSYRDRVELKYPELNNGDTSVVLKNITMNDSGKYECFVLWKSSGQGRSNEPELTSTIDLLVTEGPAAGNLEEGHTEARKSEDGHIEARKSEDRHTEEGQTKARKSEDRHIEDGHTEEGNSEDRRGHLGLIAIPVVMVAGLICSVVFRKQMIITKDTDPITQRLGVHEPVHTQCRSQARTNGEGFFSVITQQTLSRSAVCNVRDNVVK